MICDFSPVAFYVLKFPIHWYSLAYIFGILLALMLGEYLLCYVERSCPQNPAALSSINPPSPADLEAFLNYAVIGIVVGGRLGHVLFYDFDYYCSRPIEILQLWKGGMSFFGGFLGAISAACLFCCIKRINFWSFADIWAVGVPIGRFLGGAWPTL